MATDTATLDSVSFLTKAHKIFRAAYFVMLISIILVVFIVVCDQMFGQEGPQLLLPFAGIILVVSFLASQSMLFYAMMLAREKGPSFESQKLLTAAVLELLVALSLAWVIYNYWLLEFAEVRRKVGLFELNSVYIGIAVAFVLYWLFAYTLCGYMQSVSSSIKQNDDEATRFDSAIFFGFALSGAGVLCVVASYPNEKVDGDFASVILVATVGIFLFGILHSAMMCKGIAEVIGTVKDFEKQLSDKTESEVTTNQEEMQKSTQGILSEDPVSDDHDVDSLLSE